MEDVQMLHETFEGAGLEYTLSNPVQDNNINLVEAYVNGHRVPVGAVAGANIQLATPGYDIDAEDKVIFVYQF